MHLLLVSATEFEIKETALWLKQYAVNLNSSKPELLITGIGQLQTAYALQKKIFSRRPDLVIQAGIGGSAVKEDIGKVVAIQSDWLADLGVLDNNGFQSLSAMGLDEENRFPFLEGKLKNPFKHLLEWTGLPCMEARTVNEIKSSDSPDFKPIHQRVVESMEGASLHYVCLMEKIPFLQIRAISNLIGERDKSQWKMKEALERLNEMLVLLLQKLQETDETLFRI